MSSEQQILAPETLEEAGKTEIFNNGGGKVNFGEIFVSSKAIVVFIRHFFCGMCHQYVTQLAAVSQKALQDADVKIVIIGCGDWQLIRNYKESTGFTGEIYTDPSRELHKRLGMTIETIAGTPSGEQKRSYVKGVIGVTMKSILRGPLSHPLNIGKQGNIYQNGGEFILGPGNTCQYAHIMKHSQDHAEVADLLTVASVNVS